MLSNLLPHKHARIPAPKFSNTHIGPFLGMGPHLSWMRNGSLAITPWPFTRPTTATWYENTLFPAPVGIPKKYMTWSIGPPKHGLATRFPATNALLSSKKGGVNLLVPMVVAHDVAVLMKILITWFAAKTNYQIGRRPGVHSPQQQRAPSPPVTL